jgi:predicted methyltransferase
MISLHNRARVANFRPTVARALTAALSGEGERVLDFCSGFSGRLLGVVSLKRHYVGIDAGAEQHSGSLRLVNTLATKVVGTAELYHGCSEDVLPEIESKTFDLVISSPPYFKLERYPGDGEQSFNRYKTYSEWRDLFLRSLLTHAHRLLKSGGKLVLNVADVGQWPVATDTLRLSELLFGNPRTILSMAMSTNPAEKQRQRYYRSEPIFVFERLP